MAASLLPRRNAAQARARLFSLAGFQVGPGTRLHSSPRISGGVALFNNLIIGKDCSIDEDCVFDLEECITIGDRVSIGPGTMILTSTHELGKREHRAGPITKSPVRVDDGALLGARSIILPGVTVGAGAVVNPGAATGTGTGVSVSGKRRILVAFNSFSFGCRASFHRPGRIVSVNARSAANFSPASSTIAALPRATTDR